jgi:hypothetical protein
MSTDFSVRPAGVPAATPVVRPLPEAARDGVRTQLPAAKSVTASESAKASRGEGLQIDRERLSRQMVFDQDSAQFVYLVVDSRTDNVVAQVPDEAKRRARAYFIELERAKDAPGPQHTDRTV